MIIVQAIPLTVRLFPLLIRIRLINRYPDQLAAYLPTGKNCYTNKSRAN
jgi:hypothetical protein